VKIQARYGEWFDEVLVDGKPLSPKASQQIQNHSPDGFAWGYSGSGPAQLALALLLAGGLSAEDAQAFHQDFKRQFIAGQPQRGDWELELDIRTWALGRKAAREVLRG
jgi:hypothetical protein